MKIYQIVFRKYQYDYMHRAYVNINDVLNKDTNRKYSIDVPEKMLIMEDDIEHFKKYGDGIESITYVGELVSRTNSYYNKRKYFEQQIEEQEQEDTIIPEDIVIPKDNVIPKVLCCSDPVFIPVSYEFKVRRYGVSVVHAFTEDYDIFGRINTVKNTLTIEDVKGNVEEVKIHVIISYMDDPERCLDTTFVMGMKTVDIFKITNIKDIKHDNLIIEASIIGIKYNKSFHEKIDQENR